MKNGDLCGLSYRCYFRETGLFGIPSLPSRDIDKSALNCPLPLSDASIRGLIVIWTMAYAIQLRARVTGFPAQVLVFEHNCRFSIKISVFQHNKCRFPSQFEVFKHNCRFGGFSAQFSFFSAQLSVFQHSCCCFFSIIVGFSAQLSIFQRNWRFLSAIVWFFSAIAGFSVQLSVFQYSCRFYSTIVGFLVHLSISSTIVDFQYNCR